MKLRVEHVMSRAVVTAREETRFKELVRLMAERGVSGLPIVDGEGRLVGIVTEADLLLAEEGEPKLRSPFLAWFTHPKRRAALEHEAEGIRAADIMTRNVLTLRPEEPVHDAAKVLLDAGVRRLPVVDEGRRVIGIVGRRDLLRPYLRSDEEIRDEVTEDVIFRTMWIAPHTIEVEVVEGVVQLEGKVERKSVKELLVELVHHVDGVVGVGDQLSYERDDEEVCGMSELRSEQTRFPRSLLGHWAPEGFVAGMVETWSAVPRMVEALVDAGVRREDVRVLMGDEALEIDATHHPSLGFEPCVKGEESASQEFLAGALLGDVLVGIRAGSEDRARDVVRVLVSEGVSCVHHFAGRGVRHPSDLAMSSGSPG